MHRQWNFANKGSFRLKQPISEGSYLGDKYNKHVGWLSVASVSVSVSAASGSAAVSASSVRWQAARQVVSKFGVVV